MSESSATHRDALAAVGKVKAFGAGLLLGVGLLVPYPGIYPVLVVFAVGCLLVGTLQHHHLAGAGNGGDA